MKIDCHVHLVAVSPSSGGFVSPRMQRSLWFRILLRRLGMHRKKDPESREEAYVAQLAASVEGSELDRAVLLALDRVFRDDGTPDLERTNFYVSNDYVASVCRRFPELFLLGASVNPRRKDALEELARVAELGAVLIKWLPISQGIDPADRRALPFLRELARLGLPLLVHGGYEHTVPALDQSLRDPLRLRPALEEGVRVIVAHSGTAGLGHWDETLGSFLTLLARYPNCYGDTAALTSLSRGRYLPQLLDPALLERRYGVVVEDPASRLIHGSDFPVPVAPSIFVRHTTFAERRQVNRIANPLQRDIALKRLVGVPDACLTRFYNGPAFCLPG